MSRPLISEFPLTNLLCRLFTYSDDQVRQASAERAAKHYGVSLDHAAGYIRLEREGRGLA